MALRTRKLILIFGLLAVFVLVLNGRTGEEGRVGEAHGEEAQRDGTSLEESELESVLALPDVRSIEKWPHGIRSGRFLFIHKYLCSFLVSRFAHWVNNPVATPKKFLGDWVLLLQEILPPGQQLFFNRT